MDPIDLQQTVPALVKDVWMALQAANSAINYEQYMSGVWELADEELEAFEANLRPLYEEAQKLEQLHELLKWYEGVRPKLAKVK